VLEGDELVLLRPALGMVEVADEADRAVHGVGTAQREIDMVELARSPFGEFRRQPDGRLGPEAEIPGGVGELPQLPRRRFDDALVAVTRVHAP
jgi:hypothetical protein